MAKPPASLSLDHQLATAIGKTLGTIARKAGLGNAAPVRAPKKRTPRKAEKAATKRSVKNAATAQRAAKKAVAKKTR